MKLLKEFKEIKALFVFGTLSSNEEVTQDEKLQMEAEKQTHCDFVQFSFEDTYGNITMDTLSALKFALGWNWKPQEPGQYN